MNWNRSVEFKVELTPHEDSDATPNELAHWLTRVLKGELQVDDLTIDKTVRVEAVKRKRIVGYEKVRRGAVISSDQYDEFNKARWIVDSIDGDEARRKLLMRLIDNADNYYFDQAEIEERRAMTGDDLHMELQLALMNFNWPGSI